MIKLCIFCGRPSDADHHWIFGTGLRQTAEEDNIKDPICNYHHTLAPTVTERIHDNIMAEKLSKMLGQVLWEKKQVAAGFTEEEAREAFRKRYGKCYYTG